MSEMKRASGLNISRRVLVKGAAKSALFVGLAPSILKTTVLAQENVLYVNTWGGVWTTVETDAFYKPFTAATGIRIQPVTPVSMAKLKAEVQTGNYDWDCSNLDRMEFTTASNEKLLEPIDFKSIDQTKVSPGTIVGDGVAGLAVGTPLVYRKDKFPKGGPKSWADFWDVKQFPGPRALYDQSFTALAYALIADGVPKDKIYPMDLDRAFKKLDEIKPYIKVWWKQGAQSQDLIMNGEVVMLPMWNGRAQALIDKGAPLEIVWNGNQNYFAYWFVAKGSPRASKAWKFIEMTAQAKPQADFCSQLPYGPSNPKAFEFMTAEAASKTPSTPEHLAESFEADTVWLAPRMSDIQRRWTQWLAS